MAVHHKFYTASKLLMMRLSPPMQPSSHISRDISITCVYHLYNLSSNPVVYPPSAIVPDLNSLHFQPKSQRKYSKHFYPPRLAEIAIIAPSQEHRQDPSLGQLRCLVLILQPLRVLEEINQTSSRPSLSWRLKKCNISTGSPCEQVSKNGLPSLRRILHSYLSTPSTLPKHSS